MPNGTTLVDGSMDWSLGVDSITNPTVQSPSNPNGLPRNALAWLNGATVRDGGITQRASWQPKVTIKSSGLFQGGILYDAQGLTTYYICAIDGHIYKVDIDGNTVTDLTASNPALRMPATQPYFYFCQAEQFLIIQAGDYVTKPLFWDGTTLRRSNGITGNTTYPNINEIPAAGPMDYYMSRLWYAYPGAPSGGISSIRNFAAGDIVGNTASGTGAYNFTDSVLKVTENPLATGGDGFSVPTNAGNIRALKHNANLDTTTGQGQLFIFTRRAVYSLTVPVTRQAWAQAGSAIAGGNPLAGQSGFQPFLAVVQLVNGAVNDRCIAAANGDLWYQSLEPAIRSLISAIRYFTQWGNVEISANENRILKFNDRSLMQFSASGIVFDNRLWQTQLPQKMGVNIISKAIAPMDFIPISTFGSNLVPSWEGMYEGLNFLELYEGDFGGLQRAFGAIISRFDQSTIELWEFTTEGQFDDGDNRVTWIIEFPAFTWNKERELKKLLSGELWLDRLFGKVHFKMEWRPDGDPCWKKWREWEFCSARNSAEDVGNPISYPLTGFCESYRTQVTLPKPPNYCASAMGRPADVAYQIQPKLTITGFCRIRALFLHAELVEESLYHNLVCVPPPPSMVP